MTHPIEALLTVAEVGQQLHVSRSTVYSLIHRGLLPPPIRVGGRSRWKRSDLDRITEARRGLRKPRRPA